MSKYKLIFFLSLISLSLLGFLYINKATAASSLASRLQGYILLQVEDNGEAWYVIPKDQQRVYMQNGSSAYQIMRYLSLGITDADLSKIPVGVEARFNDQDTDSDGLSDRLEEGLGTDLLKADTDNDSFKDGEEIITNHNPLGTGNLNYDTTLVNRLKGYILLQVEKNGQAWYLNPKDGKRYYMKDGDAAYQIMRFLSLGITNQNLNQIRVSTRTFSVNTNPPGNNSTTTPPTTPTSTPPVIPPVTPPGGGGGGGGGGVPAPVPDTQSPTTPTNLVATSSDTQIVLSWTASTDNVSVSGYQILRSTTNGSGYTQIATSNTNSYTNTGLTVGVTYYYIVRAYDTSNNVSTNSAQTQATIPTPPDTRSPTTPTGLVATSLGTQIALSWTASTDNVGVSQYLIERSISQTSDFIQIDTSNTSVYTNTGLSQNTTYYYRIRAQDAAGNTSTYSGIAQATTATDTPTPDTTSPSIPTSLQATSSGTQIALSWTASTDNVGVSGYQILRATTNGGPYTQIATSNTSSYVNTGLNTGATYYYVVRAYDAANNISGNSIQAQATVPIPPDTTSPSAPTNLSATSSGTQIALSWTASTDNVGVSGYQILRSTTSGTGYIQIATSNTTLYTNTGLNTGTTYYYVVRAYDAANNTSVYSGQAQATTPTPDTQSPTIPTNLSATPSATQIYLSWTASTDNVGVSGYQILRSTTNGGPYTQIATSNTSSYANTGLATGSTYYYVVRAYDTAGNTSANSTQAQATFSGTTSSCVDGAISSSCSCGDATYTSGYCCGNIWNPSSCSQTWSAVYNRDFTSGTVTDTYMSAPFGLAPMCTLQSGQFSDDLSSGTDKRMHRLPVNLSSLGVEARGEFYIKSDIRISNTNRWCCVQGDGCPGVSQTCPGGIDGAKFFYAFGQDGVSWVVETNPGSPNDMTNWHFFDNRSGGTGYNQYFSSTALGGLADGNTHNIVWYFKHNTQTNGIWNSDGVFEFYIDSQRVYRVSNVPFTGYNSSNVLVDGAFNYIDKPVTFFGGGAYLEGPWPFWLDNLQVFRPSGTATPDTQSPTTPTSLNASASGTQIALSWTASTDNVGVSQYLIERAPSAGGTFVQIATSATNSYANTGLANSTTYYYRIRAQDAAGNTSAYSSTAQATTAAVATDTQSPTTPTNLTATASGTQIALSWTASTDNTAVTGYTILRSTTNGSGYTQIATSATNSYTNTGLSYSTTYYYVVRAYDAAGNTSANSTQAQATIGSAPPVGSGPSISGLSSATLVDGQSYTISGSGFGVKSAVAPHLWDAVDNQSVYNNLAEGALVPSGTGYLWQYNDTTYTAGVKFTRARTNRGTRTAHYYFNVKGWFTGWDNLDGGNANKFYATWWINPSANIVCGPSGACASTKLIRVWSSSAAQRAALSWTGSQIIYEYGDGRSQIVHWKNWGGLTNQWNRLEVYADNTSGLIQLYTNGVLIDTMNLGTVAYNLDRVWRIGLDPSISENLDQSLMVDFGEIYVDNTQARVELCTGSTWASKGNCEIQIPNTTWNDGQIRFTVNRGAYAVGQTVYLYVVDGSGSVNSSGYSTQIASVLGDSVTNCNTPYSDTLNWTSLPENILVRGCGSAIYAIENRQRLYIPNLEILRRDYPGQRVYNVSETLLGIYPIVYR